MATLTGKLTIEDFERLPQAEADYKELVDGELVDVSGNTPQHIDIRDGLMELLRPCVKTMALGRVSSEMEFNFGGNAHGPDISFYGPAKVALIERTRRVQPFVPDFAIEIVSGNDTFRTLRRKKNRYLECGTAEVWLVDPFEREVMVSNAEGERTYRADHELSTPLIPGFCIKVAELFEL